MSICVWRPQGGDTDGSRFEEFLEKRIGEAVMAKVRPKAKALMMKEFDEFVRNPAAAPEQTGLID